MTSQSAEAHLILFRRIFEIAQNDTKLPIRFRHIHGCGIEAVVADAHKGQALGMCHAPPLTLYLHFCSGLGKFCVELCQNTEGFCLIERHCRLRDLDPYDHLKRFYCLCVVHFLRNLAPLKKTVPSQAYKAMASLSSFEKHHDLNATLQTIRAGGRKANGVQHL